MKNNSLKVWAMEKINLLTGKLASGMLCAFPPCPEFPHPSRDSPESPSSSLYRDSAISTVVPGRCQKDYVRDAKVELQPRPEVVPSRGGKQAEKNTATRNRAQACLHNVKFLDTPPKQVRTPGVEDTEVLKSEKPRSLRRASRAMGKINQEVCR